MTLCRSSAGAAAWIVGLMFSWMLPAALADDAPAPADGKPEALRVCQDPNNMPFSNEKGEGLENHIAELLARKMGVPLAYYYLPQRLGFIRNTLKYKVPGDSHFRCDLVVGVPADGGEVAATTPYYRSTYALVYAAGRGLDGVKTEEDFDHVDRAVLEKLHFGVYDRSTAGEWIVKHNLEAQTIPYRMMNARPDYYPGEILERDIPDGKLDAAIVWGPIAGYYAKHVTGTKLIVVPLKSQPGLVFHYAIAMGVRYGEPAWKKQVQTVLDQSRPEILAILRDYGVPLVDEKGDLVP